MSVFNTLAMPATILDRPAAGNPVDINGRLLNVVSPFT
jgi:hypothetical protein